MMEQAVTADLIRQRIDEMNLPYDEILSKHNQLIDKLIMDQQDGQLLMDQSLQKMSM